MKTNYHLSEAVYLVKNSLTAEKFELVPL